MKRGIGEIILFGLLVAYFSNNPSGIVFPEWVIGIIALIGFCFWCYLIYRYFFPALREIRSLFVSFTTCPNCKREWAVKYTGRNVEHKEEYKCKYCNHTFLRKPVKNEATDGKEKNHQPPVTNDE